MPQLCPTDQRLPALIKSQDFVIGREQARELGLTARAIKYRLQRHGWQMMLPQVYLTHPGEPSRRQMLIAAQLYAGPDSAIDDVDALRYHGVKAVGVDERIVRVVAPPTATARTRGFVVVRRTTAPITADESERVRYLSLPDALIATTRRHDSPRRVLAILADAVERNLVSTDELVLAHVRGPRRNARATDEALGHLGAGVRSAPEGGFRGLAESSHVLPPLLYNCLLRLPDGEHISPDALALDAGLVHETNGRQAHARLDLFEDMQARHDVMTTAGLVVLHNSPARINRRGREVLRQFERCYLQHKGRGLPEGVTLLRGTASSAIAI